MKMRGVLPKQELNGLNAVHGDAVAHPGKTYLAVVLIEVDEVRTHSDKTKEALTRVVRIEVADEHNAPYLAEVLETTFESRTGKTPLDLDIPGVEDQRKRFRAPKAKGPKPDMLREPEALTAAPVPVDVDPAALAPDETGEERDDEDIVDAQVVDEDPDLDQPEWSTGYPEGQREDDDTDAAQSPTAPQFSG